MGRLIIDLAINFLICILVLVISFRFNLNKKIWSYLERNNIIKNKIWKYTGAVLISNLIVLVLLRLVGLDKSNQIYKIINSIMWGGVIAFLPGLPKLFE